MSNITDCPTCHTQFIVTNEQLSQHNGKVRCGNCLHVFDATQELVEEKELSADVIDSEDDYQSSAIEMYDHTTSTTLDDESDEIVNNALLQDSQVNYFDNIDQKSKPSSELYNWLTGIFIFILILAAIMQSIYFLRTQIAVNYPNLKPYLVQACKKISCSIDLPKKIEFIIIDDSDMQEDADSIGLIHLSSTLINQASFAQAYPNIELTLTDVEDRPKLRRIFKPEEYLPEHTYISNGLAAGTETKVKLAITAQGESVAGYRLAVNY
jgi:predicted Zn finger-like uncharacterized protein